MRKAEGIYGPLSEGIETAAPGEIRGRVRS
ncbi:hypothetical protein FHU29_001738 [Hoyosella altamirensis]|uniref:Uncharacterized protein n=1 Tax=Hoyosella altamirensis TaxID=616997 RepID=A0A839RMC6_9ACTN|nr:hypothetical protein [Hoyosella altamirensis]